MIDIVKQTIDFFIQKARAPKVEELQNVDIELLNTKWSCFVTIFLNWQIRGSAGNIKEIKKSLAEEIIENTIEAISKDFRFNKLAFNEVKSIKIRVDLITNRKILALTDSETKTKIQIISKINPVKKGIIVIKKDYTKSATLLPNIDAKLISWKDYNNILSAKLDEIFDENKYIIYEIDTKVQSNY